MKIFGVLVTMFSKRNGPLRFLHFCISESPNTSPFLCHLYVRISPSTRHSTFSSFDSQSSLVSFRLAQIFVISADAAAETAQKATQTKRSPVARLLLRRRISPEVFDIGSKPMAHCAPGRKLTHILAYRLLSLPNLRSTNVPTVPTYVALISRRTMQRHRSIS